MKCVYQLLSLCYEIQEENKTVIKELCSHFQIMFGSFEKICQLVQVFQAISTPGEQHHYCV